MHFRVLISISVVLHCIQMSLQACPMKCKCNQPKQRVKCSNGITSVPEQIPTYVRDLDLRNNAISRLSNGAFLRLPNLLHLSLSANKIKIVDKGAFRGLQRLHLLNLRSNVIENLPLGTFKGLSRNIKTIYLQENRISRIDEGVFNELSSATLSLISLRDNRLTEIKRGDFNGLEKLKTLLLERNQLEVASVNALNSLSNIRKLALSNNKLELLPEGMKIPALKVLNLANNKIKALRKNVFSGIEALTTLNLSGNALEVIKEGAFNGLQHLTTLDISDNRLTFLPSMLPFGKLDNIYLTGNLWKCDCKMQDFRRWLERRKEDIECTTPSDHKGKSFKNLEIEDLVCEGTSPSTELKNEIGNIAVTVIATSSPHLFFCPPSCVCSSTVLHINCNKQGFSNVPSDLPRSAKLLDLRNNRIRNLHRDSFEFSPKLVSLHLQSNKMRRVEANAFSGLRSLIYLYLNLNVIDSVGKDTFKDLESLSYLFLDDNRISVLPEGVFRPLSSVFTIYLRRNFITDLNQNALVGLSRLRWLYLSDNRLSEIRNGTFSHCSRLQRLLLDGNELTLFPSEAFTELKMFETLDVSRNLIDSISSSPHMMPKLQVLNLADNTIHEIDKGFFKNFKNLRHLNASGNTLQTMPALPNSVTKVNLDGNPWKCDCMMKTTYKFLQSIKVTAPPLVCHSPEIYHGRDLMELTPKDLVC